MIESSRSKVVVEVNLTQHTVSLGVAVWQQFEKSYTIPDTEREER